MYPCDLIDFSINCEACPFGSYCDCDFYAESAAINAIEDYIEKAEIAKKMLAAIKKA